MGYPIPTGTGSKSIGASIEVEADGQIRPASEWKLARSLKQAVADPVRGQDTRLKDPSILDETVAPQTENTSGGSSRW